MSRQHTRGAYIWFACGLRFGLVCLCGGWGVLYRVARKWTISFGGQIITFKYIRIIRSNYLIRNPAKIIRIG